jgi:ribonucleoside-diphosphate reductase alpha chain
MGFADYLLLRKIAYGSDQSIEELEFILNYIYKIAEDESICLAEELGIPKNCKVLPVPRRNITLTTVAPTGCQKKDTLVTTKEGIFELSELGNINGETWQNISLNVAQEKGHKKSTRFFINGKKKTKKIILSSGIELECTPNHKYRIIENDNYLWKSAEFMNVGDYLVVPLGNYKTDHKTNLLIPEEKVHFNEKKYEFPSYVTKDLAEFLGIFFGDGSVHKKGIRLHFNSLEEDYLYVADLGKRIFGIIPTFSFDKRMNGVSVCFNSRRLLYWLKTNDFIKGKAKEIIFTKKIRSFNSENLQSFLDGFHFADGSHSKNVKYIATASKIFAQQWVTISRALGKDCRIATHISGFGSKIYRVYTITAHRIIEKADIRKNLDKNSLENCTIDSIISIENSISDTFDIEVPENNCYIANGVVSHNTISLIAGCSSSIEPIFSEIVVRNDKTGTYSFTNNLAHQPYFRCAVSANGAIEVTWEEHIKILSAAQSMVDSGVSKTINFPQGTHRDTIAKAVMLAWKSGCKGIAIYRDKSRKEQVLTPQAIKKDKCPNCGKELLHINGLRKCSNPECEFNINDE